MLILAEVVLTILAWRRGWKAWALVPAGVLLAAAFMIGFFGSTTSATEEEIMGIAGVLDFVLIGTLAVMATKKPRQKPTSVAPDGQASETGLDRAA